MGKAYKELQFHEWKTLQVTLDTTDFPLEDYVEMARGSSSFIYNKYIQATSTITSYKKKEKSVQVKNKFLQARVISLENENYRL